MDQHDGRGPAPRSLPEEPGASGAASAVQATPAAPVSIYGAKNPVAVLVILILV